MLEILVTVLLSNLAFIVTEEVVLALGALFRLKVLCDTSGLAFDGGVVIKTCKPCLFDSYKGCP